MQIKGIFGLFLMAILAKSAQAFYNNNYYNNYGYGYNNYYRNDGALTYTGMATSWDENGVMTMIPVSQCPYECAINQVCGTENECAVGAIVWYVVIGLVSVGCVIGCICFCCKICSEVSNSSSTDYHNDTTAPLLSEPRDAEAAFTNTQLP